MATCINAEELRRYQLQATADEDYSAANWDDKTMNQKLLSISQSLEGAEMYVSAAKAYIESSRGVMERLTDFIGLAQVDIKTAEECMVQTERRISSLKTEIDFNLAQNLDDLQETNMDSARNIANSRSDKAVNTEQVLNIIEKYVDNSENINKYEVKHDKYNGITVIVIGCPNAHGNNSNDQDKDFIHGSKDSLNVVDQTLDCDLDSLDYTSDSCDSRHELGFYEIDHTGECCININGNCEPSFHVHDQFKAEAHFLASVNEELRVQSSNENFVSCDFHTDENHFDHSSNRENKYRTDKQPSGDEDLLIPEGLSNNVEVSIFSQRKYLADLGEGMLNKQSSLETALVESPKSENCECVEPSDFVYFSDSPGKNVEMCRSSITKPKEFSTKKIESIMKKILMGKNEDCTVNRDAISNSIVNDASCQENIKPTCRISEESTDTSLHENSYITLSETSCDTSQNKGTSDDDTSDTSVHDTSDTSVHDNLSNESLLYYSDSSYTEISSMENLSENSNMSLTDCLDSSADESVSASSKYSSTNSSDSTRSLLPDVSSSSVNFDSSALSENELSYASFKNGVSASKNRESLKSPKTNRHSTAKLNLSNEAENDKNRSLSPESESSKLQDYESSILNLESGVLSYSTSVIELTETDETTVKCGSSTDNIQNACTETETNTQFSEPNLIDVTSSCDSENP